MWSAADQVAAHHLYFCRHSLAVDAAETDTGCVCRAHLWCLRLCPGFDERTNTLVWPIDVAHHKLSLFPVQSSSSAADQGELVSRIKSLELENQSLHKGGFVLSALIKYSVCFFFSLSLSLILVSLVLNDYFVECVLKLGSTFPEIQLPVVLTNEPTTLNFTDTEEAKVHNIIPLLFSSRTNVFWGLDTVSL